MITFALYLIEPLVRLVLLAVIIAAPIIILTDLVKE